MDEIRAAKNRGKFCREQNFTRLICRRAEYAKTRRIPRKTSMGNI